MKFVLFLILFYSQFSLSFEANQVRYLNGFELFNSIYSALPNVKKDGGPNGVSTDCQKVTRTNSLAIGVLNPLSGELRLKAPNATFIRWYSGCLNESIKAQIKILKFSGSVKADNEIFFGQRAYPALLKEARANSKEGDLWAMTITKAPSKAVDLFLEETIFRLLGSDEFLKSYGKIGGFSAMKIAAHKVAFHEGINLEEYSARVYFMLMMRDEFLSY